MFWQIAVEQLRGEDRASAAKSLAHISAERVSWRQLPDLATEQVKAGDLDAALETARNAQYFKPAVIYQAVAKAQAQSGNSTLEWIEGLESPYDRVMALVGAAKGILNLTDNKSGHN
jgi:hypothetical protein